MDEISGRLVGVVYLAMSGCLIWSDSVIRWRSRDSRRFKGCVTSVCHIYVFPISNTGSRKYYLWKEYDWLKNRLFFITENFLGILDRLCMQPMRRSHDFLSLTLTVVGSTSGSCYFLQCRCLWVCVLCVLVVRCVKS